ncbi:MAG: twin-arginine translocation signal domain-containing protein, partial [Haloplanus sp.]
MNRRDLLKTGIAAGISVTIPGCTGFLGGSDDDDRRDWKTPTTTPEPEAAQETFTYVFNDQTGSLGQVGNQQIPENTPSWKVVENTLEESQWQQMQNNDLDGEEGATDVLAEGEGPQAEGFKGSIEPVRKISPDSVNSLRS